MSAGTKTVGFASHCLRAAFLLLCVWAATDATAQTQRSAEPALQPPSCLTTVRAGQFEPPYPAWIAPGSEADVRVKLGFETPDGPPTVTLLFNTGNAAFAKTVLDFALNYRMPCLAAGQSFTSERTFSFTDGARRPKLLQARMPGQGIEALPDDCTVGIRKAPLPDYQEYPSPVLKTLARMVFNGPDKPPIAEMLFDTGPSKWTVAIRSLIETYRLPCLKPGGSELIIEQVFGYDTSPVTPRDKRRGVTINQLVGLLKNPKQGSRRFDFDTMACPFKLTFELYRPYTSNRVSEMGEANANRKDFVEWLRGVAFDISEFNLRGVMGEPSTLLVPCGVLDLT